MEPANDGPSASQKLWFALKWVPILIGVVATAFAYEHVASFLQRLREVGEPPPTESHDAARLADSGWRFPAWDLDETLLEDVVVLGPRSFEGGQGASFLADGDGGGELLVSHSGAWRRYDADGELRGTRSVERWGGEVLRFGDADGSAYELEQRGPEGFARARSVACLRDGEVVWERASRERDWIDTDTVRLGDGRALVLLFSHDDWLALHADGEVAWDRSAQFHAGYNHCAHPRLPGRYLCCFGDLGWRDAATGGLIGQELDLRGHYVTHAEALPGPGGEALAFAVGTKDCADNDCAWITVVDEDGVQRWTATGPDARLEATRLDRGDAPPLFVVAATSGDLFVVDGAGTVLHHRTLPEEPDPRIDVAIYDIDAGPFGPDHYGVAVTTLKWIAVYRLDR